MFKSAHQVWTICHKSSKNLQNDTFSYFENPLSLEASHIYNKFWWILHQQANNPSDMQIDKKTHNNALFPFGKICSNLFVHTFMMRRTRQPEKRKKKKTFFGTTAQFFSFVFHSCSFLLARKLHDAWKSTYISACRIIFKSL